MVECALCGKRITGWAYLCSACLNSGYADTDWGKALIAEERKLRRISKTEERRDELNFSDIKINSEDGSYDGWDVIDGDIGYHEEHPENVFPDDDEWWRYNGEVSNIWLWKQIEAAGLSKGERRVIRIQLRYGKDSKLSSEEGARRLSRVERQSVSPEAFRRRLSDARRKLREAAPRLRPYLSPNKKPRRKS